MLNIPGGFASRRGGTTIMISLEIRNTLISVTLVRSWFSINQILSKIADFYRPMRNFRKMT